MNKILTMLLLLSLSLLGRDVIDVSGYCEINWTLGEITCKGESEVGQGQYAAKLVSKVVAQRNLLEVIKGIKIDSTKTVKDGLLSSDIIESRVEGMIKGAEVISSEYHKKDGYGTSKVKIRMGKDLLNALLSDPTQLSWNEKIKECFSHFSLINSAHASTYNFQDKQTLKKILEDFKDGGKIKAAAFIQAKIDTINDVHYSGILIDVSNVNNFEKAMIVRLVDEKGKEIYPAKKITKRMLTKRNTSVGYMFGFDDARKNKRVYAVPLELKVEKVYKNKKSNIVLTSDQVQHIQELDSTIFENAKIILVLGD